MLPAAVTAMREKRILLGLKVLTPLRPTEQQMLLVWAAVVGVLGAAAALLFQVLVQQLQRLFTGHSGDVVAAFAQLPWWHRFAVPIVGAALAGAVLSLAQRFVRRRETDYMEAISLGSGDPPLRPSLARAAAAMLSIASGEAIGREGPLVQLAAITGSLPGRLQRMSPARKRMLVACGAAAGIAAAYHTALGGALFVAEIVLGSLAMEALGPLLLASVASALTVRSFQGITPLYRYTGFELGGASEYLLFAVLGILCGFGATGWMRLLQVVKRWFGAIGGPTWLRLALGGVVVGALAVSFPEVTGNGATMITNMLAGQYAWRLLLLLVALRIIATTAAFGSGAVGGVFTPSLLVGAAIGFLFASGLAALWPNADLDAGAFALIGMGSFMAGAAQAPITAIIMLFEFTLQYEIVLPLMVGAVACYFTTHALGAEGLYAESLRAGPRGLFDRPMDSVTVGDLMRPQPAPLRIDTRFGEIARSFLRSPDRELWIADRDGRLAGAVFLDTVQPFLKDPHVAETVIALDILSPDVTPVRANDSLTRALERFTHDSYDTLPVTDAADRLVGALVREDLLLTISEMARREKVLG